MLLFLSQFHHAILEGLGLQRAAEPVLQLPVDFVEPIPVLGRKPVYDRLPAPGPDHVRRDQSKFLPDCRVVQPAIVLFMIVGAVKPVGLDTNGTVE